MSSSCAAWEDMVGVLALEPDATASWNPSSASECNLKDSPINLVILHQVRYDVYENGL